MLIKMSSGKEIEELSAEFKKFDKDGTGMIDQEELLTIIDKSKVEISREEIKEMIAEIDYQGNGKINYSEFLAATVDLATFMSEAKLTAIFK